MATHVVLLRGVNNLGGRRVAMAELLAVVTSLGHADVMTYIQSENGSSRRAWLRRALARAGGPTSAAAAGTAYNWATVTRPVELCGS